MNWALTAAGFGIGVIVGLTGMGGGALMTPMLILIFGVPPLAAVSNDLVVSAVMRPVGALVHIKQGRIDWKLVGWLCAGSVPFAFAGVLLERAIGGESIQHAVQIALGVALLLAALGLVLRAYMKMRTHARKRAAGLIGTGQGSSGILVRPVVTAIVGAVGGLVVGMTSVGSGSLMIVALLALYPTLKAGDLVGTDLVQAVPLVASAALGHVLFGDFQFSTTVALLIGSIPGVFLGAQVSARAQGGFVRRALTIVLMASALGTLKVSNNVLIGAVAVAAVGGPLAWSWLRTRNGLPALARHEKNQDRRIDRPAHAPTLESSPA